MDDRSIKIEARISAGILPGEPPAVCWGGVGTGHLCNGCDERLAPPGLEIECDPPEGPPLRFHVSCFLAWVSNVDARVPAAMG